MIRRIGNLAVGLSSLGWLLPVLSLRADHRYQEALDRLSRRFRPPSEDGPSTDAPLLANILFADLNVRLERLAPTYHACASALTQMADPKHPLRLGAENTRYLKYHCKWMLTQTTKFVDSEAFQLALSISETWADINLARTGFKGIFPIQPEWALQFDEYIAQNAAL